MRMIAARSIRTVSSLVVCASVFTSCGGDATGPARAVKLAILDQPPATVVAGQLMAPGVRVAVQEEGGGIITTETRSITLVLTSGTGTAGAVLSGGVAQTTNGVASFSNLQIDKAGAGYTLTASVAPSETPLAPAVSTPFTVVAGQPAKLVVTGQPENATSLSPISPVRVTVQDATGNVPPNIVNVTIAITAGTGSAGAVLAGTRTRNSVNGVVTFDDLTVDKAGAGYTLSVTAGALAGATTGSFVVNAGAPAKLAFAVQPASLVSGAAANPAVQVAVQDVAGNTVTSNTSSISVAIAAGTGATGATLAGTLNQTAASGIATFANLSIDKAGTAFKLAATSGALAAASSVAFDVAPGPAASLAFVQQPPSTTAVGAAFTPALRVSVRDANGNTATTATTGITLALSTNSTGAVLGGTTSVSAANGVATFSAVSIDKPGQGFTVVATATGLAAATSTAFDAIGPATKLVFATQPGSGIRNGTLGAPVLTIQDAAGNVVATATNTVTIAIGTNAGSGTLAGTLTRSATAGRATFDDLSINASGTGYTLAASASGLAGATSTAFDVAPFGAASKLGYATQPTQTVMGASISPAVQITILDASGNAVTTSSAPVTVALGSNPGSAMLGGTLTVNAASGVASFANLTVSAAGTGYTLVGSSPSLTGATSAAFNVTDPAAPSKLAFVQQPTGTTAGSTLVPAVTVAVQNAAGATITSDNSTVVSMTLASAPAGGTLRGTLSATAANGIATFNALNDSVAGTYTLRATAGALSSATSASYVITAGAASKLRYLTPPVNTVAGALFATPVQVAVTDTYGNTVSSATNSIGISDPFLGFRGGDSERSSVLKFAPPTCGNCPSEPSSAPIAGSLTVAAVNGIATFADMRIRFTEVTRLQAYASSLDAATDVVFFKVSPSTANQVWAHVPVTYGFRTTGFTWEEKVQIVNSAFEVSSYYLDSLNNQVNVGSGPVSIAIGANPGGATLTGATNVSAVNGRADFGSMSLDVGANRYTLIASSAGFVSRASIPFDVAAFGTASRVGFKVQPTNVAAGASIAPAVQICVQDGVGNTVTSATNTITVAIGTNPGSATLGGTLSAAAVSGCASFANLTLSATGSGYTLTAGATSLTGATSSAFNVTP